MSPTPLKIQLTSYRCFGGKVPVEFELTQGKTLALVGKNNAGKSALMRFFFEFRSVLSNFAAGSWNLQSGTHVSGDHMTPPAGGQYGLTDLLQLFPKKSSDQPVKLAFSYSEIEWSYELIRRPDTGYTVRRQLKRGINPAPSDAYLSTMFGTTLYVGAHRNVVNQSAGGSGYYDLSVGSAFVGEWHNLRNGASVESAQLATKAERLIADLLGWQSINIAQSADSSQLYVSNGDERYAITELGAGISELVICIVTAASKKPSWILIDEPEAHLHPAMQIKFLEALESLASEGVVFTTHSIGLARTCADQVLVVEQDSQGRSSLRPFEGPKNYSELMGELSFAQMHELGFDRILLCEGVTDVKTLRQFLRLWRLDAKVMIVPLGGSSLIDAKREEELREFNRFGVDVFVIVDSERDSATHTDPTRTAFVAVCEKLFGKGHAMQTERRATENYFTEKAIKKAMRSDKYHAPTEYENAENQVQPFWGKNANWKVAAQMDKDEVSSTDLGQFIERMASK